MEKNIIPRDSALLGCSAHHTPAGTDTKTIISAAASTNSKVAANLAAMTSSAGFLKK